jgi:glycosyltransferase involved in cell wall biosynthesis
MKIGVWVDKPIEKISGGSFTYLSTLITGIDDFNFSSNIEIVFVSINVFTGFNKPCLSIDKNKKGVSFLLKIVRRIFKIISKEFFKNHIHFIDQKEKRIKDNAITAYLKSQGIRMIFYPTPSSDVINGIPYILNNWDLAHYTTYAFPEITDEDGFDKRNSWYTKVMPSALMIFVETEAGKKELITHLNIKQDKIRVLPIFSSYNVKDANLPAENDQAILNEQGVLKNQFFFYPAQFWAHKNHYILIKAFEKFIKKFPDFKLLLCGSDKGNKAYIENYINELGIKRNVTFSGFVKDSTLYILYKNASALIMPTLLGPSNIPPIEALLLGCPILCSDLDGHKEILGDSALYFNPLDDLSVLKCMELITDDFIRNKLLIQQNLLTQITDHTIEKSLIKLQEHFIEAANIRNCWI